MELFLLYRFNYILSQHKFLHILYWNNYPVIFMQPPCLAYIIKTLNLFINITYRLNIPLLIQRTCYGNRLL